MSVTTSDTTVPTPAPTKSPMTAPDCSSTGALMKSPSEPNEYHCRRVWNSTDTVTTTALTPNITRGLERTDRNAPS